jgi:hypothetical protein
MTKLSITIYDHETGETIVREMNEIELAEHQTIIQDAQALKQARETLAAEKKAAELESVAKLTALGLNPLAFGLVVETPIATNE